MLAPNTRLGPYEIVAPLGAGGMGEVYRARDGRLDREVAVKVLPDGLARDPERAARFQREAKLLASLNHPNIAQIYGIEEHRTQTGGTHFLVLELVEGETLSARLKRTNGAGIPIDEALDVGKQIAQALEAAHEKGVIHRDLKPANVMLRPDGTAKVLDFGLARAASDDSCPSGTSPDSPTITAHYTRPGVILGTAAYMSPEQARGRPVDKRADIWSFGCLMFECLAGRRPFEGETTTDIIGAILQSEPDWDHLPRETSPLVQLLLRRCLAKDRSRRLHDIADARVDLETALTNPGASGFLVSRVPAHTPRGRGARALSVLTLLLLSAIAGGIGWRWRGQAPGAAPAQPVRFSLQLPESQKLAVTDGDQHSLALDRTGSMLVFAAFQDNKRHLFLRRLDSEDTRVIPGTEGGRNPFFSPDGRWLGFIAGVKLMKVSLSGGPPLTICEAAPGSATWLEDGSIIFTVANGDEIRRVSSEGGTPTLVAVSDRRERVVKREQLALGFDNLRIVPGADYVLAQVWDGVTIEDYDVVSVSLSDGSIRKIIANAGQPMYVAPSRLVFMREDSLFVVPFDVERGVVTGEAELVLDGILTNIWADSAQCAVALDGTLAYLPGGRPGPGRRLVRVDATGKSQPLMDQTDSLIGGLRPSPDGSKVCVLTMRRKIDLWTFDLARRSFTLVDNIGEIYSPIWKPDGNTLLYQRTSLEAPPLILSRSADAGGETKTLTQERAGTLLPNSVSPDGKTVLLTNEDESPQQRDDIFLMQLDGSANPQSPVVATTASESNAVFSPDGKWFAYDSDETGRDEVYVRTFPDIGRKWQISTDGGFLPRWSHGGDKVFFLNNDVLYACSITQEGGFLSGRPEKLFDLKGIATTDVWNIFDVLPDDSFVMVEPAAWELEPLRIRVVVNWASELIKN